METLPIIIGICLGIICVVWMFKALNFLGCMIFLGTPTSIVGYAIHHSLLWGFLDWVFFPLAWVKWLVCQEVSISIIKHAFSFFFN